MTIFVLLGGLFSPIENMPAWARVLAYLNPVSYFIEVMRMIVLKGSGFFDVINYLTIIVVFAIIFNSLAIINYKKIL